MRQPRPGRAAPEGTAAGSDLAALAIRLTLGPTLMCHGFNKVAGPGGLAGTTRWFEAIGLRPAGLHARMAAATELSSGALFTLGALNPAPAAAMVGLMAVAARTDHRGKGFFVFKGGGEYVMVFAAVATAAAALGPGRWSVDGLRGRERKGAGWALAAAAAGLGSAAALLATSYAPDSGDEVGGPEESTEPLAAEPPAGEPADSSSDEESLSD